MSSLLPSSSPAWLAPVWDERSHSQGTIRCVPRSSQRGHRRRVSLAKGTAAGRARRGHRSRTGSRPVPRFESASRTAARPPSNTRSWRASSSMLRAGASRVRLIERTKAAAIASRKSGAEPSTSLIETETIAAFSTSEPRPKVRTVSGNRTRIRMRPEERIEQRDQAGRQQHRLEARHIDARQQGDGGPEDQGDENPEDQAAQRRPRRLGSLCARGSPCRQPVDGEPRARRRSLSSWLFVFASS